MQAAQHETHEILTKARERDTAEGQLGEPDRIVDYLLQGPSPHQALGNRMPIAMWRQGITGRFGTEAVDMLDNARALSICPQPQQQQQTLAMIG
jgi:hypothetical protein